MELDRAGLQILSRADCMGLLRTTSLGRIGISWQAMPMVLPVHFALDAGRIVITTWDGSILSKATRGTVVAFEADGPTGTDRPSWSVLVNGVADHLEASEDVVRLDRWVDGHPHSLLSISTEQMTGRSRVEPHRTPGPGQLTMSDAPSSTDDRSTMNHPVADP